MGFYDRDYYREPSRRRSAGLPNWSMITYIIVINVVLFFANGLFTSGNKEWLTNFLMLKSTTIKDPLSYWQFLTYGFVHDPRSIWHIAMNMLTLFFLGGPVERRLGSREFLRFYLATIIFGGVVWSICNINTQSACLGASGGVVGVCILFTLMFPHHTIALFGVLPMPAWMCGVLIVLSDLVGAAGFEFRGQRIAVAVHLAGAFFAFMYDSYKWNFGQMLASLKNKFNFKKIGRSRKPNLNIYRPDDEDDDNRSSSDEEKKLAAQLDEVLKKYSQVGESGLTSKEREILKKASSHYQKKYRK